MNSRNVWCAGLAIAALTSMSGCMQLTVKSTQGVDITNIKPLYTLTNLHPDQARKRLYSVNYQQAGLIPLCTEVEVLSIYKKAMKFKVKETGVEYTYLTHRAIGEGLELNIPRYFGKECNAPVVKTLSRVNQKGIQLGMALKGMSKEGVTLALGAPPKHRTPSLAADTWVYWKNRWATMKVNFNENGNVESVIGG